MTRLEKLLQMEQQQPEDDFLKYAIAMEHIAQGKDADAQPYLELLFKRSPMYLATYLHLGKLYERLELFDKCLPVYQKGIEVAESQNNKKALEELKESFFLAKDEDE